MELTEPEKQMREMVEKTKGMICPLHKAGASIALIGYPGEVCVKTCCKEFGDEIAKACDVVPVNFKVS